MKKKFKWKKLIIILIIVAAAIIVAVLFARKKLGSMVEANNFVQLEEVKKQDLSDFISLTGSVSGETKMNYSSSASTEFATVEVEVGDEVKEGDVLATLDKESIQSQIDSIEKNLSNASALRENQKKLNQRALESAKTDQTNQLNQANQAINSAEEAYTAAENTVNSVSAQISDLKDQMNAAQSEEEKADISARIAQLQEQLDAAKGELSAADKARSEAKANYNSVKSATDEAIFSAQNAIDVEEYNTEDDSSIQTQLDDLYKQLEDCTITSKGAGIVTSVNISAGDMNTPNTAVVTVESNQSMIMTANVSETDILKLEEGMKAVITADALEDQEINGEVIKVVKVYETSMSGESTGAQTGGGYSVQIRLDDSELISGMSAKAKIILTDKADILCVPYDLIQEDESGQSYVLCAEDNGDGSYTAVRKNIEVGDEINYYTEVTGGDVKEGDYVILDYSIAEGDVFHAELSMNDMGDSADITVE